MTGRRGSNLPAPTPEQRRIGLRALRELGFSTAPPDELLEDGPVLDHAQEDEWR